MTCLRCSSKMYHTTLKYDGSGSGDFTTADYYKCPICAHQHFLPLQRKKRVYIKGQKVKGVLPDHPDLTDS